MADPLREPDGAPPLEHELSTAAPRWVKVSAVVVIVLVAIVLAKLLINVVATIILLAYMRTLSSLGDLAAANTSPSGIDSLRSPSPVLHASAALILLLVATALAIYKPRGMTRYGHRKHHRSGQPR